MADQGSEERGGTRGFGGYTKYPIFFGYILANLGDFLKNLSQRGGGGDSNAPNAPPPPLAYGPDLAHRDHCGNKILSLDFFQCFYPWWQVWWHPVFIIWWCSPVLFHWIKLSIYLFALKNYRVDRIGSRIIYSMLLCVHVWFCNMTCLPAVWPMLIHMLM